MILTSERTSSSALAESVYLCQATLTKHFNDSDPTTCSQPIELLLHQENTMLLFTREFNSSKKITPHSDPSLLRIANEIASHQANPTPIANEIASQQANPTQKVLTAANRALSYASARRNNCITYYACDMHLFLRTRYTRCLFTKHLFMSPLVILEIIPVNRKIVPMFITRVPITC